MGDETDRDGPADQPESEDPSTASGDDGASGDADEPTDPAGDADGQPADADDGRADADTDGQPADADDGRADADTDGEPADADDPDEGSAGDDADEGSAGEDADEGSAGDDPDGEPADAEESGLSPPDEEALADPGQAPSESVEPPADADGAPDDAEGDGTAGAEDASGADDTSEADDASEADAEEPAYGSPDTDREAGDALPDDSLADPDDPLDTRTSEADGGVVTESETITPVDDPTPPEETGDLWEEGRPSEPPDDEEMPLADHIEEMMRRLAVVVLIAGSVSLVLFPLAEIPIDFLWNNILPGGSETDPRVYGPLELMFTRLKVASLGGLVVALPAFVYETYQFMRPGLYPHERRYYLAAVPTSLVLALVGIGFAYFFVLPAIFIYFLEYTKGAALVAFSLKKTFDLILILMGYLAIVFQIPLFVMLAIMMGLTTRQWLADHRIYFWGGFLGVSFFFGIDPTGMAPIIVAATMVVLFEGTLLLLKWTGRG